MSKHTFASVMADIARERSDLTVAMPTERDALEAIHCAIVRLRDLGWNDAIYCPKDGTPFETCQAGSTGVHRCTYGGGDWPNGFYMVEDGGDIYPMKTGVLLWRPVKSEDRP